MGGDQGARDAEQDRDGYGRAGVAVKRDPGRDHGDHESHAAEADEHTEGTDQGVFGEVLDQLCPQRLAGLRQSLQLVDENPDADPLHTSQAL